jgi:predicted metal-dependent HD superfamily phosphohydrolase
MSDDQLRRHLAACWDDLARRIGANGEDAIAVLQELTAAYSEPGRHYHNLRHLAAMLDVLRRHGPMREPEHLELAAWFHDAVYDPHGKDNEERSAEFAADTLKRLGLAAPRIERVATLILMTRDHRVDAGDRDAQLLVDADLAILGAPPDDYKEYASAIRHEYAWVPEADYRAGRRAVLQQFLSRPRIFLTASLFAEREAAARRNLAGEIADLS